MSPVDPKQTSATAEFKPAWAPADMGAAVAVATLPSNADVFEHQRSAPRLSPVEVHRRDDASAQSVVRGPRVIMGYSSD
jgi:hypothetical protein